MDLREIAKTINNITGTDKSYFVTVQSQAKFQKQV